MHVDEVHTDASLVRRLLAAQFSRWADLPITPVASAGTDNAIYRLGDSMAVRLPRIHWAVSQADFEYQWLPRLAAHLPLAIPAPLELGTPAEGYPWSWSIYRWLDGENAIATPVTDPRRAAAQLGEFVTALRGVDTTGGPPSGRGVPLAHRDQQVRAAIESVRDILDVGALTAAWDAALAAPAWPGAPRWLHGDLLAGNLLVRHGRLSAVIDFGAAGVGDPACDTMAAWTSLPAAARTQFRTAVEVDDATWARGRGWALCFGLVALPYYQVSNPTLAGIARHAIDEVLADPA